MHFKPSATLSGSRSSSYSLPELSKHRVYATDPIPFFMGRLRLEKRVQEIRRMLITSLRAYDSKVHVAPIVTQVFGAAYVGLSSSGCDELYPAERKAPGRPSKRKLAELSLSTTQSSKHLSSDAIRLIHFQAIDNSTSTLFVFVDWETSKGTESSWLPSSCLPPSMLSSWQFELEKLCPGIDLADFPRRQFKTPPTVLIFDE